MSYFQAIFLGIIQGITEWLPISSQAMVTLAGRFFFDFDYTEALGAAIWFHSGTLLAVTIYFRRDIFQILGSFFKKNSETKTLLVFLILATLASGVLAVPLLLFAFRFEMPDDLFTLLIGLFLIITAFLQKNRRSEIEEKQIKLSDSLVVGLIQGLSALPGFSRAGLTIATFLAQKYSLKKAFYLSFLMSIPVTFGAQVALPLLQKEFILTLPLILGSLTAGLVGFVAIKGLLQFSQKVNFFKATLILGIITILLGFILFLLKI